MRACWCACAPAKAKRPIAQYMPDLSLAQGWSGAQSMLAGALLLGVCSRKNKQTHGAADALDIDDDGSADVEIEILD